MKRTNLFLGFLVSVLIMSVVFFSGCIQQQAGYEVHGQKDGQIKENEFKSTEINLRSNGLEVVLGPSKGKKISGVIKLTLMNMPPNTTKILISLSPQGLVGNATNSTNVILQWIEEPSVGKEILLNTTKLENGIYNIAVSSAYEGAPKDSPWSAIAQEQIIVEN